MTFLSRVVKLDKPARRGPKPRRPLPRAKARIKRSVPVKKRSDKRARVLKALAEWGEKVKARAGYQCELAAYEMACYGPLDPHHHFRQGPHPRLRFDTDNGIALCRNHHDWADTPRGRVVIQHWFEATHPERWKRLEAKAAREGRLS